MWDLHGTASHPAGDDVKPFGEAVSIVSDRRDEILLPVQATGCLRGDRLQRVTRVLQNGGAAANESVVGIRFSGGWKVHVDQFELWLPREGCVLKIEGIGCSLFGQLVNRLGPR